MDTSANRRDIDLSVREISNAVKSLEKTSQCKGDGEEDPSPCFADFWRWFWE